VGALETVLQRERPITLGVLHELVPDASDAWTYTLDVLERFFERALAKEVDPGDLPMPPRDFADDPAADVPSSVYEVIGAYLEHASLLGTRTGELHRALASERYDPAFAPEPFTTLYQRSLYQSMRNLVGQSFRRLERARWRLPDGASVPDVERLVAGREAILRELGSVLLHRLDATRIRVHGDFHLGQVLHTGRDFMIIDFEGEPNRPIGERRLKRSPLVDVAGMLRSFDYATSIAADTVRQRQNVVDPSSELEPWAELWRAWVSRVFQKSYYQATRSTFLLPSRPDERDMLVDLFVLEKSLYELGYEIDNRPHMVHVPARGILRQLDRALERERGTARPGAEAMAPAGGPAERG